MTEKEHATEEERREDVETPEEVEEIEGEETLDEEQSSSEEVEETEEDELESLRHQLEEEQNKYLRLYADFDNYRRRQTTEMDNMKKYRAQSVITSILPVLDNFERALSADVQSEDAQSLKEGVEMIQRNLLEALHQEGLAEIEAVGQPFDPNFHQAVMTGQDDEADSGVVLEQLQKGYTLNGRVIRPSMVKVNE